MMKEGSWKMAGGLDLTTPRIERSRFPGGLILCINHEARTEGYRRIDGYERFDGRPSPSALPIPYENDTEAEELAKRAAITARRDAIEPVPGVGHILGVWRFKERTYAFRKKDGFDTIGMYGSGEDGWTEINLYHRVFVQAMSGTPPQVGDVIGGMTSGATATLLRLVRLKGDYSDATAEGIMIIDPGVGGLQASELLAWTGQTDDDQVRTSSVPQNQDIAYDDSARFRFANYNFYGQASGARMYGVSGTDFGFEFDGEVFTPLVTGVVDDKPIHIATWQNHLWLGYVGGSTVASALGMPVNFDAIEGAAEVATGDEITGLLAGYRGTLFIFGRNRVATMKGTSSADWIANELDVEAGAIANTIQLLEEPTCYDDRGIRNLSATQQFGDFSVAALSEKIRPLLDAKRDCRRAAGGLRPDPLQEPVPALVRRRRLHRDGLRRLGARQHLPEFFRHALRVPGRRHDPLPPCHARLLDRGQQWPRAGVRRP